MKKKDLNFSFKFVDKPKIYKEINKLDSKKACQEHDIPVKLIKYQFHRGRNKGEIWPGINLLIC